MMWFLFSAQQLLVSEDAMHLPTEACLPLIRSLVLDDSHHVGEAQELPAPKGWIWKNLRQLYSIFSEEQYALAGKALQLINWDRTHTYCGQCGHQTIPSEKERCRMCPSCDYVAYPKVAPVVMGLIQKEGKILLARHAEGPFHSVLAGFVEPQESLEQALHREVLEEVGLHIQNLRYFGSQPWPFSNSLIVAFTCDWKAGEIVIDGQEILEADWFEVANLPPLPSELSIARQLIDSFCGLSHDKPRNLG